MNNQTKRDQLFELLRTKTQTREVEWDYAWATACREWPYQPIPGCYILTDGDIIYRCINTGYVSVSCKGNNSILVEALDEKGIDLYHTIQKTKIIQKEEKQTQEQIELEGRELMLLDEALERL